MINVITGIKGVGKTTIASSIKGYVNLDKEVKKWYSRKNKLYWDIKENFGSQYVGLTKVKAKKLRELVFNSKKDLDKLDKIVKPYIETFLNVLRASNQNYLVEMAIYLNHENWYKKYFDKVILVSGSSFLNTKQTIQNNKIDYDLLIKNNDDIIESIKKIEKTFK